MGVSSSGCSFCQAFTAPQTEVPQGTPCTEYGTEILPPSEAEVRLERKRGDGRKGNKARVGNAAAEEQGEIHLASHKAQRTLTANVRSVLREAMKLDRVCAVLGDKEAEAILSAMEFFEFLPGEAVVEQGTTGNTFFIAQTGSLQAGPDEMRCVGRKRHQQDYRQFLAPWLMKDEDSIRLFDGLTDSQKEKAAESAFKEVFETGARLVTAGEDFAAIYFVKKGELRVMRGGKVMADGTFVDGQVLATLGPGTSLGEALLSGGNARWENTVVASSSSEVALVAAVAVAVALAVLCISVPELKSLLGEDLGRVLENSLVLKAMQESAVLSQFSSGQRSEISKWITVRTYAVGAKVEDHAGFLVVLKGQIKGKWQGEAKTREQGDWLEDMTAGPEGARVASLSKGGLSTALEKLGLAAVASGEDFAKEVSDLAKKMLMVRTVIPGDVGEERAGKAVRG
ncbi:hypothetical protein AK812_SmicGene42153 [Symbiodinium microadriaticum]|uniref:Cyclic nucleotide-binding domain-containing protein n=1 Tax=Symbiodinium microadriaticum TaxID=2951 RepID=A0A1Q9C4A8_SYMMI|nr:hypothetical protein AK812_SmicGene42153 [Symbiodinium microadriaticum]